MVNTAILIIVLKRKPIFLKDKIAQMHSHHEGRSPLTCVSTSALEEIAIYLKS
jgi:hypothetical protein